MIAALAPLLVGPLADWQDALVLTAGGRPVISLARLLDDDPGELARCIAHFGRNHPAGDRRALASEWSKRYFVRLLPPVLAAALVLDHGLPLRAAGIDLVLDEDGAPFAFRLPGAGGAAEGGLDSACGGGSGSACTVPPPGGALARLTPLIDDHLAPVIAALSAYSRLSPRVFWSNAGNYAEAVVRILADRGNEPADAADPRGAARVLDVVDGPYRPDGKANPFFNTVRYRDVSDGLRRDRHAGDDLVMSPAVNRRWRQRRVCCVRYLLPGQPLCGNCPLLLAPPPTAPQGVAAAP